MESCNLNRDCLLHIAQFIDHPRDWYSFAISSTITYNITKYLKTKKMDEAGFYRCITQFDKNENIRTKEEFEMYERSKRWGFRGNTEKSKEKNKYRVYPVYENPNDVNSLEWWLIYY